MNSVKGAHKRWQKSKKKSLYESLVDSIKENNVIFNSDKRVVKLFCDLIELKIDEKVQEQKRVSGVNWYPSINTGMNGS